MTCQEAKAALRRHQEALRARFGVRSMKLFGSVARNEAQKSSDVDVLVDFDRPIPLFDLVALKQYLEQALGVDKVDVVPQDCIYPELETAIVGSAVDVG